MILWRMLFMYIDYVIQDGDTIESIALAHNIPMYQLLEMNHLEDALSLTPGNTLKIPSNLGELFVRYQVQKGDTLSSIAREYGTTVQTISQLNGLENSDFLYENMELVIPREGVELYFTEEGDTLENVARRLSLTPLDLLKYNHRLYLLPSQVIAYKKEQ